MILQRGAIILIVGEALFIIGIILAIVWGIQTARTVASVFQPEIASLIKRVSIEPGSSVEAATTQVTDISKPITVAIHIQRLGDREETAEGDGLGSNYKSDYNSNYNYLENKEKRD